METDAKAQSHSILVLKLFPWCQAKVRFLGERDNVMVDPLFRQPQVHQHNLTTWPRGSDEKFSVVGNPHTGRVCGSSQHSALQFVSPIPDDRALHSDCMVGGCSFFHHFYGWTKPLPTNESVILPLGISLNIIKCTMEQQESRITSVVPHSMQRAPVSQASLHIGQSCCWSRPRQVEVENFRLCHYIWPEICQFKPYGFWGHVVLNVAWNLCIRTKDIPLQMILSIYQRFW